MDKGYISLRGLEDECKVNIRYMYLMGYETPPHKTFGNFINETISLNEELTSMHREVLDNLESIHEALLRMNRSIQAEGTFGVMKYDRR